MVVKQARRTSAGFKLPAASRDRIIHKSEASFFNAAAKYSQMIARDGDLATGIALAILM